MINIYTVAKKRVDALLDNEIRKLIDNIHDVYTDPAEKRKIRIDLDFSPTADRKEVLVEVKVKSQLAKAVDVETRFRIEEDSRNGGFVLDEIKEEQGKLDFED